MKQESFCPLQRRMLAFTESDKKVTNHSATKTCISRLLDADVPENFVAQLSGHKSTESLQSYKSASAKYQKRMSLTLSRADVSGSRGGALSSVHNQGSEVVTRSTTDIAASSTTTTLIDQSRDPLRAALKHGIRNPETETESRKRKRKRKRNTESMKEGSKRSI